VGERRLNAQAGQGSKKAATSKVRGNVQSSRQHVEGSPLLLLLLLPPLLLLLLLLVLAAAGEGEGEGAPQQQRDLRREGVGEG
jgi:hypothetical protein